MPLNRWRVAKALLYSGLLGIFAAKLLVAGANPTWIGVTTLIAMLVIFVGEVKEIEVAGFLTVIFRNGSVTPSEDEDEME